ncbi:DUF397 domain-containing protein [Actinomadura macra]|uniref:DUF397 domain-containing protein n=1 Tax=Actinomadura macra TaxID=46164 RepID=UPI0008308204|nr:DUF397 domain-containing protein [Actinomadura macra]
MNYSSQQPLSWRKSSRSNGQQECVEVAPITGLVAVRDSKQPDDPPILLLGSEFAAVLADVRAGRYDIT